MSQENREGELHSAILGGAEGSVFTVRLGKIVKAAGFLIRDKALEAAGLKE